MQQISHVRPRSVMPREQMDAYVLKQSCSVPQVFGEGVDSVKKSLEGIFDDTVPDGKVINISSPAASLPFTA